MTYLGEGMYQLSDGRRFYAKNGVLGINSHLEAFQGKVPLSPGWDVIFKEFAKFDTTVRQEIATYMIQLWERWAGATEVHYVQGKGGG